MAEETKEFAILAQKIEHSEKSAEERELRSQAQHAQTQETLQKISQTISKIHTFQTELNHTNKIVDDVRQKTEKNAEDIISISNTIASDRTIMDELKQWRLNIAAALIALAVGAVGSLFIPRDDAKQLEQLTKAVAELAEKNG